MDPLTAWIVLVVCWLAPLVHVAVSRRSGSLRPPPGAGCPFGPRAGWLVIVLLLGAIGWLMFMGATRRRTSAARKAG